MALCPFGLKAVDLVAGGPGSARAGRRWPEQACALWKRQVTKKKV